MCICTFFINEILPLWLETSAQKDYHKLKWQAIISECLISDRSKVKCSSNNMNIYCIKTLNKIFRKAKKSLTEEEFDIFGDMRLSGCHNIYI